MAHFNKCVFKKNNFQNTLWEHKPAKKLIKEERKQNATRIIERIKGFGVH